MLAALMFALGASVGSFLNVVADRLPEGRSILGPASHCPACKTPLRPVDLVPIISYLWLRGRCRYCGASIPFRLVAVEASTGLLFMLIFLRLGLGPEFAVAAIIGAFLMAISIIDMEHGIILKNMLLSAMVVALALAPFWPSLSMERPFFATSGAMGSVGNSLVAGAGAYLFFSVILLVYPKGMGTGDAKLAGVLGLFVGFPEVLVAVWLAVVGGGLIAITLLALRRRGRKSSLPFGPFLAAGAMAALLVGPELVDWYLGWFPALGDSGA